MPAEGKGCHPDPCDQPVMCLKYNRLGHRILPQVHSQPPGRGEEEGGEEEPAGQEGGQEGGMGGVHQSGPPLAGPGQQQTLHNQTPALTNPDWWVASRTTRSTP